LQIAQDAIIAVVAMKAVSFTLLQNANTKNAPSSVFVIEILTIRSLLVLTDAKGEGEWAGAGLCIELSETIHMVKKQNFIF
jgi:hypothetical protein